MRQERFGYVLMWGNRGAPVWFEDETIPDGGEGRIALRQIERCLGQPGLGLVPTLYQKGLLGAKCPTTHAQESYTTG